MPKFQVETWVDIYSLFTDIFGLPSQVVLSELSLDDISQMAGNKASYENWHSKAQQKAYEEGGK